MHSLRALQNTAQLVEIYSKQYNTQKYVITTMYHSNFKLVKREQIGSDVHIVSYLPSKKNVLQVRASSTI